MFRKTIQYWASISHTERRAKKLHRFKVLLYVNIPGHKDILQRTHFSPELHPALLPACSVRQPMVSNVSSHAGTRKGAIQRPTRGGGPHRPSAFPARGTRPSGARQRPPSRARQAIDLRSRQVSMQLVTGLDSANPTDDVFMSTSE